MEQVLADTTLQTRTLMLELAPPGLHENGLVEALRWLADRVAKQQRLLVTVEDDGIAEAARGPGDGAAVPDRARAAAERGQTRALQARHGALRRRTRSADDRRASIRASASKCSRINRLPTRQGGFGLFNIRERLKLMGGSIDIHSVVGEGTTVRIRVPLKSQHGLFDEALRA